MFTFFSDILKIGQLKRENKELRCAVENCASLVNELEAISWIGHWEWDIVSGNIVWSNQIFRIFGLNPQAFDPTYERFLNAIHPDDQADVIAAVNASVNDPDVPYDIIHRIVHPDGEERIVHERGNVQVNEDGTPKRMLGTVQDITETIQKEKELKKLAFKDPLTGLYNRRFFCQQLGLHVANYNRSPHPFSLLFIDMDDFGDINNIHGHDVGDAVLFEFAERLRSVFKREVDVICRMGGDEFVVLIPCPNEASDADTAKMCCNTMCTNLLETVTQPYDVPGMDKELIVTVSIGVALQFSDHTDAKEVFRVADGAMYDAKKNGKNQFEITVI